MKYEKLHLNQLYDLKYDPILEIFSPEINDEKEPKLPLIIVVPGGGYNFVSNREKDPVVITFLKRGYKCASLTYTIKANIGEDSLYPHPYLELMCSIKYLKDHADELNIDKNKVALIGFSAGGHLCATYPYMAKEFMEKYNFSYEDVKINANVLCYPVIDFGTKTHGGSKINLIGNRDELIDKLSAQKNVAYDYPPSFIWNTLDDNVVPEINAKLMFNALKEKGIPTELLQFEHGPHGLSTIDVLNAVDELYLKNNLKSAVWIDRCDEFLKKIFKDEK